MSTMVKSALPIPPPFMKSVRGGVQVKGWEGVNLEKVAREIGVGGQYLREVLKGNRTGSIELFTRFGEAMGWCVSKPIPYFQQALGTANVVMEEVQRRRHSGSGSVNGKPNGTNGTNRKR